MATSRAIEFSYSPDARTLTHYTIPIPELGEDEQIASIIDYSMDAVAAAYSITFADGERAPAISTDGKGWVFWPICADPEDPDFESPGVKIEIKVFVETTATPSERYERTAILNVGQN